MWQSPKEQIYTDAGGAHRLGHAARAAFGESDCAGAEKGEATTQGRRSLGQKCLYLSCDKVRRDKYYEQSSSEDPHNSEKNAWEPGLHGDEAAGARGGGIASTSQESPGPGTTSERSGLVSARRRSAAKRAIDMIRSCSSTYAGFPSPTRVRLFARNAAIPRCHERDFAYTTALADDGSSPSRGGFVLIAPPLRVLTSGIPKTISVSFYYI